LLLLLLLLLRGVCVCCGKRASCSRKLCAQQPPPACMPCSARLLCAALLPRAAPLLATQPSGMLLCLCVARAVVCAVITHVRVRQNTIGHLLYVLKRVRACVHACVRDCVCAPSTACLSMCSITAAIGERGVSCVRA
jgi:hypothetical protein